MTPLSLLFVAPHAAGALDAHAGAVSTRGFGGAEVQMALIASGLVAAGHRVTFICNGEDHERRERQAGSVRIIEVPRPRRWQQPAALHYWRCYHREIRQVRPGAVYQRCGLPITGTIAWTCRRLGVSFVFAVANDRDLDGRSRRSLGLTQSALYEYGRRRADLVVVQSAHQLRLAGDRAGQQVVHIPSAVQLPDPPSVLPAGTPRVLWVGNLMKKKRPMEFLRLVRALPDLRFVAAAPTATEPETAARFAAEARNLPNLEWLDRVPYAEMDSLYRSGSVLLNTSAAEGVPNTFLEAWAHGLPVFSLSVDPDGIIASRGLGQVAGSDDPAAELRSFVNDEAARRAAGKAGREYARQTHSLRKVIDAYEAALEPLVEDPS